MNTTQKNRSALRDAFNARRAIRKATRTAITRVIDYKVVYTVEGMASIVSGITGFNTDSAMIIRNMRAMERKGRISVLVVDGRVIGGTVEQFVLKQSNGKARAEA
jgi:hypothetical protein